MPAQVPVLKEIPEAEDQAEQRQDPRDLTAAQEASRRGSTRGDQAEDLRRRRSRRRKHRDWGWKRLDWRSGIAVTVAHEVLPYLNECHSLLVPSSPGSFFFSATAFRNEAR